jgi:hypothetical protein
MDTAIKTTASLGFMLRDLNTELSSRFVDELLIGDCHAKGTNIKNRAKLRAFIGLGNTILAKYSMIGRVSILIRVLIEEAKTNIFHEDRRIRDELFEDRLSRPALYNALSVFPGEFSPVRLAAKARLSINKLRNDYKNFGFLNMIEWRVKRTEVNRVKQRPPQSGHYRTIITDENAFCLYAREL